MATYRFIMRAVLVLLVGGCVGQPSQHRSIEQDAAEYKLIPVENWVPSKQCHEGSLFTERNNIAVTASNLRYRLPNGVTGAAFCFRVPEGSSSLELNTYKRSTWKNNSGRILFPSILYLDGGFKVISDDPRPARSYPIRFMKPEGARVETSLAEHCKYVVVYLNPAEISFTANTDRVNVGAYANVPKILPSSPFGEFNIEFGK